MLKKEEKVLKGLGHIYLNQLIRSFGFSLISIFIPIYLLTIGFSLNFVLSYFIIYYIVLFVFSPISLIIAKKIGYRNIMLINIPIAAGYFLFLNSIDKVNLFPYLVAIIGGIEGAFYWIPLGSFFVRQSHEKKRGSQFGWHIILGQIGGFIAPLVGGIIGHYWGLNYLLVLSSFFILFSAIPLFFLKNIKPETKISFSGVWKSTKTHKKYFIVSIFQNLISEVEFIIWPIFIFFSFKNLISVGIVGTLISLGMIIFTFVLAKVSDRKNKYLLLKLGAVIYVSIWVSRIYLDSPVFLYTISVLAGFFMIALEVPFQAITYDKAAKHRDPDEFIVFKEIPNLIARVSIFGLMIILPYKFISSFIIAGLACFILLVVELESKKR